MPAWCGRPRLDGIAQTFAKSTSPVRRSCREESLEGHDREGDSTPQCPSADSELLVQEGKASTPRGTAGVVSVVSRRGAPRADSPYARLDRQRARLRVRHVAA